MRSAAAMRKGRTIAVCVIAAALSSSLVSAPTASGREARETLTSKMRILGSHVAASRVHVPRNTSVFARDRSGKPPVILKGRGRLVGFVLVAEGSENPPLLGAVRLDVCLDRSCAGRAKDFVLFGQNLEGQTWKLPAGPYRLYLLADNEPVTVKLNLQTRAGQKMVRPLDPARFELRELSVRTDVASRAIFSAGDASDIQGYGVSVVGLVSEGMNLAGARGTCVYQEATPDSDSAWLPGCPQGDDETEAFSGSYSGASRHTAVRVSQGRLPKGLGAWQVAAGIQDVQAFGFWLSFQGHLTWM